MDPLGVYPDKFDKIIQPILLEDICNSAKQEVTAKVIRVVTDIKDEEYGFCNPDPNVSRKRLLGRCVLATLVVGTITFVILFFLATRCKFFNDGCPVPTSSPPPMNSTYN